MEMCIVIKSLGIVLALVAVLYMLKPDIAKRFMLFFQKGNRIYLDGMINFALASVLFVGARECKYSWIIIVCGIVFMAEGLLIFGLGPEKTRPILDWSGQQPEGLYQFLGLFLGAIGIIIIFSA